jgi:hypothetical protein
VERLASVLLRPDLSRYSFGDYLKHRAIARTGHDASIEALRAFWQGWQARSGR